MKQICIGMVGAGRGAYLHAIGYSRVHGCGVRLKTIVDVDAARARQAAEQYGFERASERVEDILNDPEIDLLDICTPPTTHLDLAFAAFAAGKHVICEKPMTGYFGLAQDAHPVGETVPKARMYSEVLAVLDRFKTLGESTNKRFFYAENGVYAAPVQQTAEVLRRRKSKILYMRGEYSLKGSSSAVAGEWRSNGGGSLLRNGCHALTPILYLKQLEGSLRNEAVTVTGVVADTGVASRCLSEEEHRHISARPQDVEDYGTVSVTFSDNTKALVTSTDLALGGTHYRVDVYCNDAALLCNMNQHDAWNTYFTDDKGLERYELAEMIPFKQGWTHGLVADEVIRGYTGEMQDFIDAIAYNRPAQSEMELAYLTTKVIYAAYQSAQEGRRILL